MNMISALPGAHAQSQEDHTGGKPIVSESGDAFWESFIGVRIAERLNAQFYPDVGAASVGVMLRCFGCSARSRRFDVVFLKRNRFPDNRIPDGDVQLVPDLVVNVLSTSIPAYESMARLEDALEAAVPLVWVVNPTGRTIRVYRAGMTTKLFRCGDLMENEPLPPGFRLVVGEVIPERT